MIIKNSISFQINLHSIFLFNCLLPLLFFMLAEGGGWNASLLIRRLIPWYVAVANWTRSSRWHHALLCPHLCSFLFLEALERWWPWTSGGLYNEDHWEKFWKFPLEIFIGEQNYTTRGQFTFFWASDSGTTWTLEI